MPVCDTAPKAVGGKPWIAEMGGVEVEPKIVASGNLAVVLSCGRRIEVKRGFDAGTLRHLITVLERI